MMEKQKIPLLTLDLRTKLLLMLVTSIVAMTGYRGNVLLVKQYFFCVPFLLLLFGGKPLLAIKAAVIYGVLLHWEALLFFLPAGGGWRDVIRLLSGIATSFMPCFVMGYYTIFTTKISEFISAMQQIHMSPKIIIPFVVLFRFVPTIIEEYRYIQDAMRIRGIGFRKGPLAMMEYRLVPLMISLVKTSDDLSAAAATRGLSAEEKRTNLCHLRCGVMDGILCLIAMGILLVFISSGVTI
jgi:energy-coupling factor transporter transmembrane protein EcfT